MQASGPDAATVAATPWSLWLGPRSGAAASVWESAAPYCSWRTDDEGRADEPGPRLAVVVESTPGETSTAAIQELRHRRPLAPFVLLGLPWVDGRPSVAAQTGVPRVSWHAWPSFLRRYFAPESQGLGFEASLSPLFTTADRIVRCRTPTLPGHRAIGLVTNRTRLSSGLAASLTISRKSPLTVASHEDFEPLAECDAVVWDALRGDEPSDAELARLRADAPKARIVVCVGFPRPFDFARLHNAGADAVLAKPTTAGDLHATLFG